MNSESIRKYSGISEIPAGDFLDSCAWDFPNSRRRNSGNPLLEFPKFLNIGGIFTGVGRGHQGSRMCFVEQGVWQTRRRLRRRLVFCVHPAFPPCFEQGSPQSRNPALRWVWCSALRGSSCGEGGSSCSEGGSSCYGKVYGKVCLFSWALL